MLFKPNGIILTDANFWISLYNKKESSERKEKALRIYDEIRNSKILMPWPIMFEILINKFIKQPEFALKFESDLKKLKIRYLYDKEYRKDALSLTFRSLRIDKRKISLVDMIIRYILDNEKIKKDYFVTFNEKDFFDVCKKKNIQILN